jgi:hypothetical protein
VIEYGKRQRSALVDAGDGPDMIIHGPEAFYDSPWKTMYLQAIKGGPVFMVDSNHAPQKWLEKCFENCVGVNIARYWEFELPNFVVHVRHGHEYFIDWYFLRWIAPPVALFMLDHFPKLWYKIAKKMGWMPGMGPMTEKRYHIVVQRIWNNMVRIAIKREKELGKPVVVLSAHTHALGKMMCAFHGDLRVYHADSGTVAINSFCECNENVELKRLDAATWSASGGEMHICPYCKQEKIPYTKCPCPEREKWCGPATN